jgi:hypothetical protein
MSASNWVRGVVNNADRNRTQEPVDVRRAAIDVEPEPDFDPEAAAIHDIVTALRPLRGEARARVLQYIGQRFPAPTFED